MIRERGGNYACSEAERLIARGHQCDVSQAGYYWARLIVREPPAHLPQRRAFPMLCDPSVVRIMRPGEPLEIVLSADVRHRTTCADWIFLQRIPDYSPDPTGAPK